MATELARPGSHDPQLRRRNSNPDQLTAPHRRNLTTWEKSTYDFWPYPQSSQAPTCNKLPRHSWLRILRNPSERFDSLFKTKIEFVAKKRELNGFFNTVSSDEATENAKQIIKDATITKDKTPYVSVE